jgi:hypothetical protein
VLIEECSTYEYWSPKVLKTGFRRRRKEEEVSRWAMFEKMGVHSKLCSMSREVTSGAKSRQFRSEWTPLGVHVCLDE